MLETCTLRFFHDFNTKGNRQRLAATTSSMFRIFSSTFFPWNSPNFKAHLYGACIPDGMIVSQLCAVDGIYCNFCWRLIRSSSVILNGLEGIVKEQPTVDKPTSFLCHRGCIYWRHMRALQRWLGLTSKMYPISWCHGFSRNLNRSGCLLWQATNDVVWDQLIITQNPLRPNKHSYSPMAWCAQF